MPAASNMWRRMELVDARIRANGTTLWIRAGVRLSQGWGRTQSQACPESGFDCPSIHPRGRIQSPACEYRADSQSTRGIVDDPTGKACWQVWDASLNPALPLPITTSILF